MGLTVLDPTDQDIDHQIHVATLEEWEVLEIDPVLVLVVQHVARVSIFGGK